jgi:hypothetical protein
MCKNGWPSSHHLTFYKEVTSLLYTPETSLLYVCTLDVCFHYHFHLNPIFGVGGICIINNNYNNGFVVCYQTH